MRTASWLITFGHWMKLQAWFQTMRQRSLGLTKIKLRPYLGAVDVDMEPLLI